MNDEKRRRARELMKLYYGGIVETENKIVPPELETVSISGNTLNFNTDIVRPLNSLILHIEPHQSGSGDPSPSNIRPISGYDAVNVYRSGADTSNPTVYSLSLSSAGTVYGGSLDVTSGELVVDRFIVHLKDATWTANGSYANTFNGDGSVFTGQYMAPQTTDTNKIANTSEYTIELSTTVGTSTAGISLKRNATGCYVRDTRASSVSEFTALLAAEDPTIILYYATPLTYQLTPTEVTTLLGENTIWMDANGTIDTEYWRIKQ